MPALSSCSRYSARSGTRRPSPRRRACWAANRTAGLLSPSIRSSASAASTRSRDSRWAAARARNHRVSVAEEADAAGIALGQEGHECGCLCAPAPARAAHRRVIEPIRPLDDTRRCSRLSASPSRSAARRCTIGIRIPGEIRLSRAAAASAGSSSAKSTAERCVIVESMIRERTARTVSRTKPSTR